MYKNKKAIIFDFDGVFWDSENIWKEALSFFNEFNNEINYLDIYEIIVGKNYEEKKDILKSKYNININHPKILEIENDLLENVSLTKNFENLLKLLVKRNIKICIGTGAPKWVVLKKIKKWNLEKYFNKDNIITYDDISEKNMKGKPAPDTYILASRKIDVEPKDCLVIDDSKSGICAAISANMDIIPYLEYEMNLTDMISWLKEKNIDHFVKNIDELIEIL